MNLIYNNLKILQQWTDFVESDSESFNFMPTVKQQVAAILLQVVYQTNDAAFLFKSVNFKEDADQQVKLFVNNKELYVTATHILTDFLCKSSKGLAF